MRKYYTTADLPMLRELRDSYRRLLEAMDGSKDQTSDPEEVVALALMRGDLFDRFNGVGRHLTQLERYP